MSGQVKAGIVRGKETYKGPGKISLIDTPAYRIPGSDSAAALYLIFRARPHDRTAGSDAHLLGAMQRVESRRVKHLRHRAYPPSTPCASTYTA